MVKPERRTKADVVAAVAIVAVVSAAAALIWWTSDARATISRPAAGPAPSPRLAHEVPGSLKQLWTAPNAATDQPVVVAGTVVTADERAVQGRDPVTGQVRWSYSRSSDLCGVSGVYRFAVAVYRDDRGCGQVSTLEGPTGTRGPARSSYADQRVTLSSDGTTVLSAGDTRLELWRSDMVRMLSYGEIDARIKPYSKGLYAGCRLTSAAASSSAVSVLEACGKQADLRLALLRPGKEEDEPEQHDVPEPGIGVDSGARVLTVAETRTAVYLPVPQPRVDVVDETGSTVASTLLPKPPSAAGAITATRQSDHLVDRRHGDGLRRPAPDLPLLDHARRLFFPVGPGDDDGRQAARPGDGRYRRLRSGDRGGRGLSASAPNSAELGGDPRRRGLAGARAARRHPGRAWLTGLLARQESRLNVGSALPDFQCLSSDLANS